MFKTFNMLRVNMGVVDGMILLMDTNVFNTPVVGIYKTNVIKVWLFH